MKKKFNHYVSLSLLLLSVLPFSLVSAETVEEVPTGETTISSMADDPLKELKEKAANQVPTIESTPESESVEDTPTNESETKEDVPKTEDTTESKPKPQARGGGIGPQAVNLIEGVDIDAQFAHALRTYADLQTLGSTWSGFGKGADQLTDDDMAALKGITFSNFRWLSILSLQGIEYAKNLETLNCEKMTIKLTSLDLSQNTKLKDLRCGSNNISSLDLSQNTQLVYLSCKENQITSLDVSHNPSLEYLDCSVNSLTNIDITQNPLLKYLDVNYNNTISGTIDTSQNTLLEDLRCRNNSITSLDFSSNPKLILASCDNNSGLTSIITAGADDLKQLSCEFSSLTTLDVSLNLKLEILYVPYNKLTSLNVSGASELKSLTCDNNQLPDLDVSQNKKLTSLVCYYNKLTNLTIAGADSLTIVNCYSNQLTTLDASQNAKLETLYCYQNKLTDLDVNGADALVLLECYENDLSTLDVSQNQKLQTLDCKKNKLTNLDIAGAYALKQLYCDENQLSSLDVSQHVQLEKLTCNKNELVSLIVSGATELVELTCNDNKLPTLDVSHNVKLQKLLCGTNSLTSLSLNGAVELIEVNCDKNKLVNLDVSQLSKLKKLFCQLNNLTSLVVAGADSLEQLTCRSNKLTNIDVSQNYNLIYLYCESNQLSDITSAYGLSRLIQIQALYQAISIPVPKVTGNQAVVDILKTTNQSGLTSTKGSILGSPVLTPNGDLIELSNVTRENLENKFLQFEYDGSQLTEGAISGSKSFSGNITFYSVGELDSKLEVKPKRVNSGDDVEWTWTIESVSSMKSEDIRATLVLPAGLALDTGSIEIDGVSGSIGDIDGTNSLGDLTTGQKIKITFTTTATGSVDEWIEAEAKLNWKDTTPSSPHSGQTKGAVQILDDEQTYTPNKPFVGDLGLTSVPVHFHHGVRKVQMTAQTYGLDAPSYQSNTNVVTDGFYTRIKDDRAISTGWKLTAKLSDFEDSSNQPMPNGTGTMLKLENMSIERVTDRDTPQEVIDPTPSGSDVPSSVQATETLVAGQSTAKTIVSAQPNEGQDTWQLRMPFDKVSLSIPANAGKKGKVYKANLTWSLDDTP